VPHLHFHIMPRQEGDGFRLWEQKEYGEGEAAAIIKKLQA
jgi:diadenosine tetraphosphate (Ap4A) HIT family hydrolase